MNISMEKKEVVKLYCYIWQGERSIDHSLNSSWNKLQHFYDEKRKSDIKQFANDIHQYLGVAICPETMNIGSLRITFYNQLWGRLFSRFSWGLRRRLNVSSVELFYMSRALDDLIVLLGFSDQPQADAIIPLRLRLRTCAEFLELRLMGWRMLDKARHVEHFNSPDFMKTFRIEDVCAMV